MLRTYTIIRRGMKVYTKTGDKGTSQLFNGERRPKDDAVFEALGSIDECNAMIGLAREFVQVDSSNLKLDDTLEEIMSRMFDIGACVATPKNSSNDAKLMKTAFQASHTSSLEAWIDEMDKDLPPLTTFILPSGGKCSAHLHVARTLARRAERKVVPLVSDDHVDAQVGIYLNRLSDFLFMAARYSALKEGVEEKKWRKVSN